MTVVIPRYFLVKMGFFRSPRMVIGHIQNHSNSIIVEGFYHVFEFLDPYRCMIRFGRK